ASRRKPSNIARRRRLDDEGDDISVATEVADDSQSDVSARSDADEFADADNSDLSEVDSSPPQVPGKPKRKVNGTREIKPRADVAPRRQPSPPIARSDAGFAVSRDTDMMMNGPKAPEKGATDAAVDFDTGNQIEDAAPSGDSSTNRQETPNERKKREHEEYKKKRDADPAFIPNRGAFFMHDHRHIPGQTAFRPYGRGGRGGGRGRGAIGGPFSPANLAINPPDATDSPWQHDLHETVVASSTQGPPPTSAPAEAAAFPPQQPGRAHGAPPPKVAPPRNFSTTVHTHNAQVRVFLPEMKAPIYFQNVPIKSHTRLPNHRPPLRRDKPVRISLPPAAPRYIFPTVDRSFIFIPRALRPNQQGFGRGGRNRGFGSFGAGFSSRRTSAYGGSVYTPSVAMSRRSSLAREMGRDSLVSPAGSMMSRPGGYVDSSRPVVRLPPGPKLPMGPPFILPHIGTPVGTISQQPYPLPQKPAYRENWQGQIPMHQPRPQKTVSVAGIESPASMTFNPPQQQEQQPFHQQIPTQMNGHPQAPEQQQQQQQQFYPHVRQPSYPGQTSTGTPLSNIPERSVHAAAFQPYQQPGFAPQGYTMPGPYYPQNGVQQQFVPPGGMVPMFVPNAQQAGYVMPMAPPVPTIPAAPTAAAQPNMVAYESNGMTYYVESSQLYTAPPMEGYPQPSYAVPGMGGMMTPSPEGAYYYPQQMQ
ncbi:hypothetical protein P154DRAFT_388257, partial [Amniculicola lignicola CBS 123094]